MEGSRNMQSAFSFKLQMKSIPAAIRACMRHGGLLPVPKGYDGWPLPRQELRILPEHIQLLRA
ncbi:MAG TPA: hypothetical protein VFN23_03395, partial [Ktedonobacteraceae bacterium]|nr:hypothetical protein [Ktedonobacteraceae bacterium]